MRGDVRAARAEAAECGEQRRRTQLAEERIADAERRWRSAMDERDSVSDKLGAQAESAGRKKLNEERAAAVERLGEAPQKRSRAVGAARQVVVVRHVQVREQAVDVQARLLAAGSLAEDAEHGDLRGAGTARTTSARG